MATTGFFNDGTYYVQSEFAQYFKNMFENGISINDDGTMAFKVSAGSGKVSVAPGYAIANGYWFFQPTEATLAISIPSSGSAYRLIVIEINASKMTAEFKVLSGSAATKPAEPAITQNNDIYQLCLASVLVNSNGIMSITDCRPDRNYCGAIRPKGLSEMNEVIASAQERFQKWFEAVQPKVERHIYIQADEPQEAVEGSIWIHRIEG